MTSRRASPPDPQSPIDSAATPNARAIVESLRAGEPTSAEMFEAFWHLDSLPVDEVRDALSSWVGPLPDIDRLDPATRRAIGLPPRALRLRTIAVDRDADLLDLGPVAEEQLRIAGKSWDGADLSAEERLDGELDGSFAGTLERRVLGDAETTPATPLFDMLLFGGDSGVVFTTGTTKVVAMIAYRLVEMRERRIRIALQEALEAPTPATVGHSTAAAHVAVIAPAPETVAAPEAAAEAANVEPVAGPESTGTTPKQAKSKAVKKTRAGAVPVTAKKTATTPKKTAAKLKKKVAGKKAAKTAKKTSKKGAKKTATPAKKTSRGSVKGTAKKKLDAKATKTPSGPKRKASASKSKRAASAPMKGPAKKTRRA